MVCYVAITAVLNLALGYALAVCLGAGSGPYASAAGGASDDATYSDVDSDA